MVNLQWKEGEEGNRDDVGISAATALIIHEIMKS